MLLGDRDLATLPALAELVQVGEDDLAEERVEAHRAEQRVEHRLRVGLVEVLEGRAEVSSRGAGVEDGRAWFGEALRRERGRFRRCDAFGQVPLHAQHSLEVVSAVEPESARRTRRLEKPVAALPGAQKLRTHTRALAQLADSEKFALHLR